MKRKNYVELAGYINQVVEYVRSKPCSAALGADNCQEAQDLLKDFVEGLGEMLGEANPKFKPQVFLDACFKQQNRAAVVV